METKNCSRPKGNHIFFFLLLLLLPVLMIVFLLLLLLSRLGFLLRSSLRRKRKASFDRSLSLCRSRISRNFHNAFFDYSKSPFQESLSNFLTPGTLAAAAPIPNTHTHARVKRNAKKVFFSYSLLFCHSLTHARLSRPCDRLTPDSSAEPVVEKDSPEDFARPPEYA